MELSNFTSIVLYLTVFLASVALAYIGQKKKYRFLILIALLLPVVLAGFRYSAGTDSTTYRNFYEAVGNDTDETMSWRIASGSMEPFVVYLSAFGNFLHLPVSFIFVIFASITVIFLYATAWLFDKKRAWLYYGMLLLIVFPESLNIMRQLAAVSVQAFALMYIVRSYQDNKRVHWLYVALLAAFSVMLHYSAALLIPVFLLPIVAKRFKGRALPILLSIFAVVCTFAFPLLINVVLKTGIISEKHLATFLAYDGAIINVKLVGALLLSLISLASYYRNKDDQKNRQLGLLMLLGVSYAAVGFYSAYLGRLAVMFWVFIILIFSEMLYNLFEKESHRRAVCLAVAIVYFVVYFGVFGFNSIVPYSFAL